MAGVLIEAVERRILWFSVLAVLLTGLIVSAVTIVPMRSVLRATTAERLEHVAAVKALTARQYANRLTGVALQVTSRTIIRQELEAFNRGERTEDALRTFTADKIADAMTLGHGVLGITRLGRDGRALVPVGDPIDAAVLELLAAQIATTVASDGDPALIGPYLSSDGDLRLAVAAPILSRDGTHQGTDVVLFTADGLGPLLASHTSKDAQVATYIGAAAPDGGTAWFTAGPKNVLERSPPPDPDAGWTLSATTVQPGNWTLIAAMPTAALFKTVDEVVGLAAVAVAVLIGFGVLVLLVLLRPMAGHALIATRDLQDQVEELQGLRVQLEDERLLLKDSNAELEQFAYAASHDMRQPLRMVISFLDLLRRRNAGTLDGESLGYIQEASDGARRLNTMIEGLLEYSRVGRLEDALKPVDLNGVLARAEANLGSFLDESGAEIEHSPLPAAMADDAQMVRLFQNLIENAVKYRHPDRMPRIKVSAEPTADGMWTIRVSDNGLGMNPAQAPRAFALFQRLHTGGTGTGLGLALCHKIVTRHGGTIRIETVDGEGTTIVFTIPSAQSGVVHDPLRRKKDLAQA
ncbi:MAG: ATP-binding protein [Rhodospirillaceae bacterium]